MAENLPAVGDPVAIHVSVVRVEPELRFRFVAQLVTVAIDVFRTYSQHRDTVLDRFGGPVMDDELKDQRAREVGRDEAGSGRSGWLWLRG